MKTAGRSNGAGAQDVTASFDSSSVEINDIYCMDTPQQGGQTNISMEE